MWFPAVSKKSDLWGRLGEKHYSIVFPESAGLDLLGACLRSKHIGSWLVESGAGRRES
jgi:hypothetical protein